MFASLAWFCREICSAWAIHPCLYLFSCSGCNPLNVVNGFINLIDWSYRYWHNRPQLGAVLLQFFLQPLPFWTYPIHRRQMKIGLAQKLRTQTGQCWRCQNRNRHRRPGATLPAAARAAAAAAGKLSSATWSDFWRTDVQTSLHKHCWIIVCTKHFAIQLSDTWSKHRRAAKGCQRSLSFSVQEPKPTND